MIRKCTVCGKDAPNSSDGMCNQCSIDYWNRKNLPNIYNVKPINPRSSFSYKGKRIEDTKAYQRLKSVKRDDLDDLEQMFYDDFIKHSSHEQSLQIIINTVEGDYSQLSTKLAKIAKAEDKELGIQEKSLKIKTDEEYDRDW